MKPHTRLLAALVAGAGAGAVANVYGDSAIIDFLSTEVFRTAGQLFLRAIFMIVVPMVLAAIVTGVYELSRHEGVAAVAATTLLLTLLLSGASVALGMILVNLLQPGAGLQLPTAALDGAMLSMQQNAAAAKPFRDVLVDLVPRNPLESAVRALDGEMLPLLVFAVILGAALRPAAGGAPPVLVRLFQDVFDACMRIVMFVMRCAPVAVFAIVFNTVRTFGLDLFRSLLLYVGVVVAGLLIQQVLVYGAVLWAGARTNPWRFFRTCSDVYLYAFSTASSNATLPLSLETAERRLHLAPEASRFVLTVGSTTNQNGTALFEGVTVLFLAQVYGLDLTVLQQGQVMLMSIIAGIGTAGIPGGSLPMVMLLAQSVGVPGEGMALILGIDRFLDMCRSAVNVSGDLVIAAVVDRVTRRSSGLVPAA